jgi:hypothetical protein
MKKPFENLFRDIITLLRRSLVHKWYDSSTSTLNEKCPFCWHAYNQAATLHFKIEMCDVCLCPDFICEDYGNKGFIQDLCFKYSREYEIKDLNQEDLLEMQSLFHNEIERLEASLI